MPQAEEEGDSLPLTELGQESNDSSCSVSHRELSLFAMPKVEDPLPWAWAAALEVQR